MAEIVNRIQNDAFRIYSDKKDNSEVKNKKTKEKNQNKKASNNRSFEYSEDEMNRLKDFKSSNSTISIISNGTAQFYKTSESNKTENTLQSDENSNQQTDTETDLYKNILAICSSLLNADDKTQRDNLIESLSNLLNENGITENVTETETETENVTETEEAATQSEEVDSAAISEIQASVKEIITQLNEDFESLYEELSNAANADERASINAQISALNLEYETEIDKELYKLYTLYGSSDSIAEISDKYSTALSDYLYKLSECEDSDEYEAISPEIKTLQQAYRSELLASDYYSYYVDLHNEVIYNYNNNIEAQKTAMESSIQKELATLYESLSNATDSDERASINEQINEFSVSSNNELLQLTNSMALSDGNESYNQYISFIKEKASIEYSQTEELSALYTELANASSADERTQIQETIKETEAKYNAKLAELTTSL